MASIFVTGDYGEYPGNGLDKYIYNSKENSDDLCSLCERHILISMVKTGIFGNTDRITPEEEHKFDVYSSSLVSFIIENVFDNDLTSFKKLLKYCVQDIKQNNDLNKLNSIYANNDKYGRDYGIQCYVINRLTYYVFHDLYFISNKNDNLLPFPKLKNCLHFSISLLFIVIVSFSIAVVMKQKQKVCVLLMLMLLCCIVFKIQKKK